MNNNPNPNPNEVQNAPSGSNRSKQIIFIIVIYIMLVMSSKFGNKKEGNNLQKLVTTMKTNQVPKLSLLLGIFENGQVYEG